jgi:hypothetical protein
MELQERLSQQRVKHIVSSYQLDGTDINRFTVYLEDLLQHYPTPLIELALTETLVDSWSTVPLVRGVEFLIQAHDKLKVWEHQPIVSTITPEQFQQITNLDPGPVFGTDEVPPSRSIVHPS